MNKKKYLAALAITVGIFSPFLSQAAVVNIAPSRENKIALTVNTEGQSINAIEGHLVFNPAEFSVRDVSDGGSIVSLWIRPPSFSNSAWTVDFSGIIPGGIMTAKGTLFTITIVPKKTGLSQGFTVGSMRVLQNDGKGTPAALTVVSGKFPITETSGAPELPSASPDTQAPDPFTPEVARDPALFNGKYFLVFSATDQHSGIDHYEVQEAPPQGSGGGDVVSWQRATSPYLLHDQTLSSDIYVRAVDKANNFRMVKISAARPGAPVIAARREGLYLIGFGILLGIGIWWLLRRQRRSL